MAKKLSVALMQAAEEAQVTVSPDKLDRLRAHVKEVRDLDLEINDLFTRVKEKTLKRAEILNKKLPDMMQEARVPSISLEPEGNAPGVNAVLRPYYHANISADWSDEKREAGFAMLQKQGMGDIIKNIITIELGRGTSKLQKQVEAALRKLKVPFETRKGVSHSTLTAWIRERYQKGEPFSQAELDTLGATVGNVVQLKERK